MLTKRHVTVTLGWQDSTFPLSLVIFLIAAGGSSKTCPILQTIVRLSHCTVNACQHSSRRIVLNMDHKNPYRIVLLVFVAASCGFCQELEDSLSNIIDDLQQTFSAKYNFHDADFKKREIGRGNGIELIKTADAITGNGQRKYKTMFVDAQQKYDEKITKLATDSDQKSKTYVKDYMRPTLGEYDYLLQVKYYLTFRLL